MYRPQRATRCGSQRDGAAIIELSLTLPVFVLILLGTIEATSMIFLQQSLEITAYESTRIALVPGSDKDNVQATADQILTLRQVNGAVVTVTPDSFHTQPYGTPISVTVSASCSDNSLISPWFYSDRNLTAQVTMMKES